MLQVRELGSVAVGGKTFRCGKWTGPLDDRDVGVKILLYSLQTSEGFVFSVITREKWPLWAK
jgi:hypothetical protein